MKLNLVKYSAFGISVLFLAGIATLMILARGTGEDITGIVAPALAIAIVSGVIATVAAIQHRRVQNTNNRSKY